MRKFLKNKRGFTIAETVISLAVITIISIGTISLMQASNKSLRRATYNAQAQNFVADVVACYRVAEDETEFKKNVLFAIGAQGSFTDGVPFELPSKYMATIHVDGATLTVVVTNGDNIVAQASFTKGGALT